MASSRDPSDIELDRLSDEELLARIHLARRRGESTTERLGRQILAWRIGLESQAQIRAKLFHESDAVIEQIRDSVIESLLKAEIRGESIGEVRAFTKKVIQRRIADHYRRGNLEPGPLAEENLDVEDRPSGAIVPAPDEYGGVEASMVADDLLAARNPLHVRVVNLWLQGLASKEIVERIDAEFAGEPGTPMSAANVDQIKSRFRRELRDALGGGA